MATLALSACVVRRNHEGEIEVATILTADTADGGDTIDLTALLAGRSILGLQLWDTTNQIVNTPAQISSAGIKLSTATVGTNVIFACRVAMGPRT